METKELVPVKPSTEGKEKLPAEAKGNELSAMEARAISKFSESSKIRLTEHEKSVLFAPIDIADIQTKPGRGGSVELYLEWAWYADRLDRAFGSMEWSISPAPWNPRVAVMGNKVVGEFVLWIRGMFIRRAFGVHEETRVSADFGDAAEAAEAEALKRCCKKMGMARDLWRKKKIEEFKAQLRLGKPSAPKPTIDGELIPNSTTAGAGSKEEQAKNAPAPVYSLLDVFAGKIQKANTLSDLKQIWEDVNIAYKNKELHLSVYNELAGFKNQRKNAIEALTDPSAKP